MIEHSEDSASSSQASKSISPQRRRSNTTPTHTPSRSRSIPIPRSNSDEAAEAKQSTTARPLTPQQEDASAAVLATPQIDVEAAPFVASDVRSRSGTGRSSGHPSVSFKPLDTDVADANPFAQPNSAAILQMLGDAETTVVDKTSARHQSLDGGPNVTDIRDQVRRKHAASSGPKPELRHMSDPGILTGPSRQRSKTLAVLHASETKGAVATSAVSSDMSAVKVDDASLAQAMAQFYVASAQPAPYSTLRPCMVAHELVDKPVVGNNPPGKGRGGVGPSSPSAAKPVLPRALPYNEFQKSRLADQLKVRAELATAHILALPLSAAKVVTELTLRCTCSC